MLKYLNKHHRVRLGFVRDAYYVGHHDRQVVHEKMLRLTNMMAMNEFRKNWG